MIKKIRKYFFAGIALILPLAITLWVLFYTFIFADNLLGRFINDIIKRIIGFYIPGISIIITFVLIIMVGFFATRIFGKRLFPFIENWFIKFPFAKEIYLPAKQIVGFLFSRNEQVSFKKVVLVEYPRKGIWSLGFLTADTFKEAKVKTGEDLLTIYLPSSPNPMTAYTIFLPKKEVIFLDIPVEDGIKLIISGGILQP